MLNHLFGESSHVWTMAGPGLYTASNLAVWPPGRAMDWHRHDHVQTIHTLAGDFEVDAGDGWRKVPPGWTHVLPPGCAHRLRTRTGHRQLGVEFHPNDDGRGFLEAFVELCREPAFVAVPFEAARLRPLRTDGADSRLGALRRGHLLDSYALAVLEALQPEAERDRAATLLSMLQSAWRSPPGVEELAARMHMSRATLQRFVKRHFGSGAAKLAERVRLDEAARRLTETETTLADCAEACGYRDVYHFGRAFKRMFGCPPGEFRRRHVG